MVALNHTESMQVSGSYLNCTETIPDTPIMQIPSPFLTCQHSPVPPEAALHAQPMAGNQPHGGTQVEDGLQTAGFSVLQNCADAD